MDIMFGLGIYVLLALVFGRTFSLADLMLTVFFAVAPDIDFVPFALLRRRLKLVSHWIIHFPLLYIPIGSVLVWIATGEWFYVTAFVLASIAHFRHDATSIPGIQWLWPISSQAYAVNGLRIVRVDPDERQRFYDRLREGASKRSILDEVRMRVGKWRPEWFRRR